MIYKVYDLLQQEMTEDEKFDIKVFKKKFKLLYPEAYDVYEFEKGTKFDKWIKDVLKNRTELKLEKTTDKKVI